MGPSKPSCGRRCSLFSASAASPPCSSHDPAEVWATAETVIRMENGQAIATGPTATMLAQERATILRLLGADAFVPAGPA